MIPTYFINFIEKYIKKNTQSEIHWLSHHCERIEVSVPKAFFWTLQEGPSGCLYKQGRVKEIRAPLRFEKSGPPAYPRFLSQKTGGEGVIKDLSQVL